MGNMVSGNCKYKMLESFTNANEYLEKYGLKEQFEADKLKREINYTVLDYKKKK